MTDALSVQTEVAEEIAKAVNDALRARICDLRLETGISFF